MNALFAFFTPGTWQLLIIAFIAMLLFGNRLPQMMRNMGRGVTEFKKGMQGLDDDLEEDDKVKLPKEPKGAPESTPSSQESATKPS